MSRTARTHRPPSPTMDSKPTNLIWNENIQSTATRGTLKRKSGRNTVHFTADSGNIKLIMRTRHWENQVSVYGAVSSWFTDLSERMQGQKSTGVKTFISEENEQQSHKLDPQEVASLARSSPRTQGAAGNCWREHSQRFEMMTPEEQLRTVCEEGGLIKTVSK